MVSLSSSSCEILLTVLAVLHTTQLQVYGGLGVEECNSMGQCSRQCQPRVGGDQCDACSFGYREFNKGCLPCPSCFDPVDVLFDATLQRYQQLLARLNVTLGGPISGVISPELLARIEEYRRLLEDLVERARNATIRERLLVSENAMFSMEVSALKERADQFLSNLTLAESLFTGLADRLNRTEFEYSDLQMGVSVLQVIVEQELRQLLEEARALYQDLQNQIIELKNLSVLSNSTSFHLQSQSLALVTNISSTLVTASTALRRLNNAISLQNLTQSLLEMMDSRLLLLENQAEQGRGLLENATRNTPIALMEASRALEAVLNISLENFELDSRQMEVDDLQNEVDRIQNSSDEIDSFLSILQGNFSTLRRRSSEIIAESRQLNVEAVLLLNRSREALNLANDSVRRGNLIIEEADELLRRLRSRLSDAQNLTLGLDTVIRNVEAARILSLMAEEESEMAAEEVRRIAANVSASVALLETVSQSLSETMQLAAQVNVTSAQILSNATLLNSTTSDLLDDVSTAEVGVEDLREAVDRDRKATSEVISTAKETISLAGNISERIIAINSVITNLTQELDKTELIPPARLQEVSTILDMLEEMGKENQISVDSLTLQIRSLQDSASKLRSRYTMLQQHRDLLQEILRNVENLKNCREQFER